MADFKKLDALMESLPKGGIPAADLIVAHRGETVYRKQVGYSDREGTRPVQSTDLYWLYSATKVVTCLAAMRLLEEGKISLSDPVSKYIPEFGSLTVKREDGSVTPAERVMTVEHLFTMTGGMTYDLKADAILKLPPDTGTVDMVRAMASEPLIFEPGTHYKYSLCHDVLAAVVEVVSGMRFSEYLEQLIFRPLGLRDIGFRPSAEQSARFSAMYGFRPGIEQAVPRETKNPYILTSEYDSGGAGLFSSVNDYIKIITVIACGGTTRDGYTLLKPETIQMMQKNRLCDDALNDFVTHRLFGYGWGLCGRVHTKPVSSLSLSPVGEFGWDGAANAFVMIDPENRIALYYGCHIMGYQYGYCVIHPTLRDLVYEGLAAK